MLMPAKKKKTKSKEKKNIRKKSPAKNNQTKRIVPPLQKKEKGFYIVGMGASAVFPEYVE
jgi:hypothetical protein